MLDLSAVKTRYYPVRFNGKVLQLEPPKLKTINRLVRAAKLAGDGDIDAYGELTPLVAQILSKNRNHIKISADTVENTLTTDQMLELFRGFLSWMNEERKNDPN